ncbi:NAD(P)H-dependent glycerol-3-phosphate dehydrogenase [Isachenkonia alkalipeptolytica]|uniref:Glycerol-3-phosphate dehydrogenase [NAD(P)+] n=1 Tax=Isachenkonia alkalipeptolytica TaxID=2565777 RepID=A0AA44BET8_9CLOT|nr:NAD(P)H-dependent glycerol-3-phosphate dehydrogenase [Isachenkonia alkalipeptolytica]NBG88530.1 NAD(P)H-dependent glycerol-3-phosphate dehydrogenase [Isachenkonia alkalipeptolytica]
MKPLSVAVIGAGSWGSALSIVLNSNGHNVDLWMRSPEQLQEIKTTGINQKYLKDVTIPGAIKLSNELKTAIEGKEVVLLSVPTQSVREILRKIKPFLTKDQIVINVAKGLEVHSKLRISEIIHQELGAQPCAVVSGPSHAEEASRGMPTTVVSTSKEKKWAEFVQDLFSNEYFRVYTNPDIVGVELGGSLKNVIAFGAGISDGLGYGDNAKAALMTRGIREIARLGEAMGAEISTFSGLSGIGDLIVTCTSMHSRNRRAGILIGQGKSFEETLEEVGMVVEGIKTTESAYELSKFYNIEMPITEQIYNVIYKGVAPKEAVVQLMSRRMKNEMEEIVESKKLNW